MRTLIQEVAADVKSSAGEIVLVIHWKGGLHTEVRVPRRRRGYNNGHTGKALVEAVSLLANICNDDLIAGVLNRNGHKTGRGNRWTKERVTALRSHHQISCYSPENKRGEGVDESYGSRRLPACERQNLRRLLEVTHLCFPEMTQAF